MNLVSPIRCLLFLVIAAPVAGASAERELIRSGNIRVTTAEAQDCRNAAEVTVHADSPAVFQDGSPAMQRLVDALQAMLRYECESLDGLHITGRLEGLDEPVFEAVANAVDQWVVQARRSVSAADVEADASPSSAIETSAANHRSLGVASIKLDMTVETVRGNVSEVFGDEPVYDPVTGTLVLDRQGCPVEAVAGDDDDYRRPGANCVTAWFTDRRIPTLYRFRYSQSASGSIDEVQAVLVENFGEPRSDAWNDDGRYRTLSWTVPPRADDSALTEALEARLFRDNGATVIDIVLADPRVNAGTNAPADDAGQAGDGSVDLTL